jgi:protein involved in temperature-dependent protein secretion
MSKTCRREQSTSSAPGEVGSAATATGGFVADHDVRVGHLLQGLPAVSLLPAGHGEDSSRVLFP